MVAGPAMFMLLGAGSGLCGYACGPACATALLLGALLYNLGTTASKLKNLQNNTREHVRYKAGHNGRDRHLSIL